MNKYNEKYKEKYPLYFVTFQKCIMRCSIRPSFLDFLRSVVVSLSLFLRLKALDMTTVVASTPSLLTVNGLWKDLRAPTLFSR